MPQQVRKGEELHRAAVLKFLQQSGLVDTVVKDLKVTQYTTGFSNLTYLLQAGGKEYVLRRPPAGAVKRGHDMSREFKVLTGLNKGFAPAPKAFVYTDDLSITGSSFYVMEKVDGIILTYKEAITRNISPAEFTTISAQWLSTFVDLHQLDYKALDLEELGRPEGYVERQVRNWGKQYLKAKTEEIPAAEKVMVWLEEQQPTQYDHALIHNDYKYDNVVFADDSWQELRAVLDWEMCTLGDPLMDLGTSLAYWSVAEDGEAVTKGWPSPTILPGNPSRDELVENYTKLSGRHVNDLVFYYAYGLFKIAVIVQQIFYRYQKGLTSDERFANLNEATRLFSSLAWRAIQRQKVVG